MSESIGTFTAKAVGAEWGETNDGKPQIGVEFEVTAKGEYLGRRWSWYGSFTEQTAKRTVQSLQYCGARMRDDDVTDLVGFDKNEVGIVVERDTYEGKERTKIAFVNKLGGVAMKKKMSDENKKAFGASLKGLVASVNKGETGGEGGIPTKDGKPLF